MPRTNCPPSYRHHKARNCAVVTIDGRNRYLGPYGSPESHEKYARLIANWKCGGTEPQPPIGNPGEEPHPSINELVLTYWKFAKTYYVKDGEPTKELGCMREAIRPLRQLYGHTNAREFGPKALKAVRQHMVDLGLCRGVVNHRISRIKRVFRWAVAEEMVASSIYHGLQAGDLYLSEGEARRELWKKAARELRKVGVKESRIESILSADDPEELAQIAESLRQRGKPFSSKH
jgi:hypothetical protein